MEDTQLLQHIHKAAVMGIHGLQDVTERITDPALHGVVQAQIREYRQLASTAGTLLRSRGETPQEPGWMAKLSSELMSAAKTMTDASASNIAEMVFQGNNMGIVQTLRNLHDYDGNDRQIHALGEKLLKTEEANAEQMKNFL